MMLVALKKLRYPRGRTGVEYQPGDSFEVASDRDAATLRAVRVAKEFTAPPQPPVAKNGAIKTRVMTSEAAPEPVRPSASESEATGGITNTADGAAPSGEINANKPNRYRRSDMRSED